MSAFASLLSSNNVGATAVLMQSSLVTLVAIRAINTTAAVAFVQLFDAAAASDVTVGTTIPTWVVKSEASELSIGDGLPDHGLVFTRGLVVASTTTPTGSTGATQHVRVAVV